MKKKLILFMLVGIGLISTSCGKTEAEVENVQVTGQISITEVATEEKTENAEVPKDVSKQTTKKNEKVTLNEAKIEQMLNDTLNWIGLQYTYAENPDIKELTVAQAIPMAYHAVGVTQKGLEEDEEYNLIVPEALLEEAMKNLFGKVYDASAYTLAEYDMIRQAEDGSLRVAQGDWGTCVPSFFVEKIEQDTSSNGFVVIVNYFTYDGDEGKNSETEYVVSYYLVPDTESAYGFVITNMVGEKTVTCEEKQEVEVGQEGYSDEELCNMARTYYTKHYEYTPPIVEVDNITDDGKVMIHLYEVVEDHTATSDWYMVDRKTAKGTNILGEEINLAE